MATYAIIHTATRIVRRETTDAAPTLAADESAVQVPDGFDIGNGPWKLAADNQSLTRPTAADLDAADDPASVQVRLTAFVTNYANALDAIAAASTAAQMIPAVQAWATLQKKLVLYQFRGQRLA